MSKKYKVIFGFSLTLIGMQFASAAINIDRTRIIFPGKDKSMSLVINNQSKTMPYLAQSWIEDDKGNKISAPFTVLPPMQRVEPNAKNQIKIVKTEGVDRLPQDRESLFYLNVREIPPVAEKDNIVQIAIQSRLKMFYRPAQIENNSEKIWAKELKYTHTGDQLVIENPTKYYVTLGYLSASNKKNFPGFESVMIAPLSKENVKVPAASFNQLYAGYMDDFGGMKMLSYQCSASICQLSKDSK